VYNIFRQLGLRHIFVVPKPSRVVGLITRKDLLLEEDGNTAMAELQSTSVRFWCSSCPPNIVYICKHVHCHKELIFCLHLLQHWGLKYRAAISSEFFYIIISGELWYCIWKPLGGEPLIIFHQQQDLWLDVLDTLEQRIWEKFQLCFLQH